MKVLIVSDAGSIHTRRWTAALKDAGIGVVLFSITPYTGEFYREKDIRLYVYDVLGRKGDKKRFLPVRLYAHLRAVMRLKKVIALERPDIVHAHYATSYGLVAAMTGFHPLIVSVWGSDIYEFPRQSAVKRLMVEYILKRADRVLSTSKAMAAETAKYYKGPVGITPFGVDTSVFTRSRRTRMEDDEPVVFGIAKTLSYKYGIDLIVRAYARMRQLLVDRLKMDQIPATELLIAGDGPDYYSTLSLIFEIGVAPYAFLDGKLAYEDVPGFYANIDVAVFLSREESFGVSAVEAMSSGLPVIASAAEGLKEILEDGGGIIVPIEDTEAAAEAMVKLATDPALRRKLGAAGREKVCRCYEWKENVATMIGEYSKVLESTGRFSG